MSLPIHTARLQNHLQFVMPLALQNWAKQEAQKIVASGQCGHWEQAQLKLAIQRRLAHASLPKGANPTAVASALYFLTLTDVTAIIQASSTWSMLKAIEASGSTVSVVRPMSPTSGQSAGNAAQDADQKANTMWNQIATILKEMNDMIEAPIHNML
jgi:hypothetical protein